MLRAAWVVIFVLAVLGSPGYAQTPPHPVMLMPLTYSDMTTAVLAADMSFLAHITARPGEVITEMTPGSLVANGFLQLDLATFPTPWAVGDTLLVHVFGAGSNYSQPEEREFLGVVTDVGAVWITELGPNGEFFLPVEISSFSAVPQAGTVLLIWTTASEVDNAGFNILRASDSSPCERINASLIPGCGASTEARDYAYRDERVPPGTHFYTLESVATDGSTEHFGPVTVTLGRIGVTLAACPTPAYYGVAIALSVPEETDAALSIHDLSGRVVHAMMPGVLAAGDHVFLWDGSDDAGNRLPQAVYLAHAVTAIGEASTRLVIAR